MEKIDNLKDIKLFIDACDNMLESKFILVDKRIGDVLKSIAKTKQVYNLMATCLVGFNFEKEWKMACSKGKELNLPIDQSKSTAFVFCLLNAIDDKKINLFNKQAINKKKQEEDNLPPNDNVEKPNESKKPPIIIGEHIIEEEIENPEDDNAEIINDIIVSEINTPNWQKVDVVDLNDI